MLIYIICFNYDLGILSYESSKMSQIKYNSSDENEIIWPQYKRRLTQGMKYN